MTTTPSSIHTTTRIRHGANTALSISFDFTALGISIPMQEKLQSLTDQAITQWWSSLSPSQRSGLSVQGLSLLISGRKIHPPQE